MQRRIIVLAAFLLGGLSGCFDGGAAIALKSPDIDALSSIHEASAAVFRNSSIELLIRPGGAIQIVLNGQVQPKQDGAGDIWIPILLTKKLPEYFRVADSADQWGIAAEAYQLNGGLWCIAAVVHRSEAGEGIGEARAAEPAKPLTVRLDLVSPAYQSNLPFIVPSGQTAEPVAVAVRLPHGAGFTAENPAVELTMARGRREPDGSVEDLSTTLQTMTAIPAALGANRENIAATLFSPDAVAFDFSAIKFSQPGYFSRFRPWFLPAAVLAVLCALLVWLRIDLLAYVRSAIGELEEVHEDVPIAVEATLSRLSVLLQENLGESASALIESWRTVEAAIRDDLSSRTKPIWRSQVPGTPDLSRLKDFLGKVEKEKQGAAAKKYLPEYERLTKSLTSLIGRLEALGWNDRSLFKHRRLKRWIPVVGWALAIFALIFVLLLLAVSAQAQSRDARAKTRPAAIAMLGNLDIQLVTRDVPARPGEPAKPGEREKTEVRLRFAALSGEKEPKPLTIKLGKGNLQRVTIDRPPVSTDKDIVVKQQSGDQISLEVRPTFSPTLVRIGALKGKAKGFRDLANFATEIAQANHLTFAYTLQGALSLHTRSNFGKHWLHLFPFDTASIDIPIDIKPSGLLSHLELQKPSLDYFAEVSVEGVPISLVESENGDRYEYFNADSTLLPVEQSLLVRAAFRRSNFQKWIWPVMVVLFSFPIGYVLGRVAKQGDKAGSRMAIFTGVGFLPTAIMVIHTAIESSYQALPRVFAGQGVTILDLVGFGCIVIILAVGMITYARTPLKADPQTS